LQSLVFIRGAGVEIPENQGARIALSEKNEHREKKQFHAKSGAKTYASHCSNSKPSKARTALLRGEILLD